MNKVRIADLARVGCVTFLENAAGRLCAPHDAINKVRHMPAHATECAIEPPADTIPCPPPSGAQIEAVSC